MSVNRDPTSQWQKDIYASLQDHYSQPLPSSDRGGLFGRSVFGFLSQTFGMPGLNVGGYNLGLSPNIVDDAIRIGKGLATDAIFGALFPKEDRNKITDRYNQLLEKSGYLKFNFRKDGYRDLILPFYENPSIKESRKADYARNKIMNRTEPIRLWTGSEPVVYKVDFSLTLPHLVEFAIYHSEQYFGEFVQKMEGPLKNYSNTLKEDFVNSGKDRGVTDKAVEKSGMFAPSVPLGDLGFEHSRHQIGNPVDSTAKAAQGTINYNESVASHREERIVKFVIFMVDLIRNSIVGSVRGPEDTQPLPQTGPPIVELKFGTMYAGIPCIATNYSLKYDERAGYHNYSMLPRKIDISLTLESFHQSLIEGDSSVGGALHASPGWNTTFDVPSIEGQTTEGTSPAAEPSQKGFIFK